MSCLFSGAEVRIQMEKEAGVYKVPCTVNGLKLKFIFDTGASNVCISSSYANMMLENGYLLESDIKGTSKVSLADGRVVDNVVINLRMVVIGGQLIENVSAIVVPTQNAPLLLGQSVIERLGRVSIDGNDLVIHNANNYSEDEVDTIYNKAEDFYHNEIYSEALKYFRVVYDFYGENTNPWVLYKMGVCYANLNDDNTSEKCYLKAIELEDEEPEEYGILNFLIYEKLLIYCDSRKDYHMSLEYSKLMLKYSADDANEAVAYCNIAEAYISLDRYTEATTYSNSSIKKFESVLKRRDLSYLESYLYVRAYHLNSMSLVFVNRYNEAINSLTSEKRVLECYKNEDFYQEYIDLVNGFLSICYIKLANQ